jgi:hypothetical protein
MTGKTKVGQLDLSLQDFGHFETKGFFNLEIIKNGNIPYSRMLPFFTNAMMHFYILFKSMIASLVESDFLKFT